MKEGRGQLTQEIKNKSLKLFGYEISTKELRLLPYIQYTLCNEQKLLPEHVNAEEMKILAEYVKRGFILNGVSEKGRPMIGQRLEVTKKFWDLMLEIIWLGYVHTEPVLDN